MRAFGFAIAACLFLAVVKQAIVALLILLAILLLWEVLFRPREMMGMVVLFGGWAFVDHHPVAAVVALAIVGLVGLLGKLAQ